MYIEMSLGKRSKGRLPTVRAEAINYGGTEDGTIKKLEPQEEGCWVKSCTQSRKTGSTKEGAKILNICVKDNEHISEDENCLHTNDSRENDNWIFVCFLGKVYVWLG